MQPSIKISKDFARQFNLMRQYSRRGLAEDVNQKAYSILMAASKFNRRADKQEIVNFFDASKSVVAQKVRVLKSGEVRRGKEVTQTKFPPYIFAIVNWQRKKRGKVQLKGPELLKAAEKEFGRRKSSIAYMASGWLAALANIARKLNKEVKKNAIRKTKKPIGQSTPASEGVKPTATFWNDAFSEITSIPNPNKFAEDALSKAMAQETVRMGEYIARKMAERSRKVLLTFVR